MNNKYFELTKEILQEAHCQEIIATGFVFDKSEELNFYNTGKKYKWVIVVGGIGDWALYVTNEWESDDYAKRSGDKMSLSCVRNFIEMTNEVANFYRG